MTKSELIEAIAARAELTKARAESVVDCVFDSMTAGVRDLFATADSDPAGIAATMQSSAEVGVAPGGECGPA